MSYDDDDYNIDDLRQRLLEERLSRRLHGGPAPRSGSHPSGGNLLLLIVVLAAVLYFVRVTFLKEVKFALPDNIVAPEKIEPKDVEAPKEPDTTSTVLTPLPRPNRREILEKQVEALLRSSSKSSWSSTAPQVRPFQGRMPRLIKINGVWVRENPEGVYEIKGERIYHRDERGRR